MQVRTITAAILGFIQCILHIWKNVEIPELSRGFWKFYQSFAESSSGGTLGNALQALKAQSGGCQINARFWSSIAEIWGLVSFQEFHVAMRNLQFSRSNGILESLTEFPSCFCRMSSKQSGALQFTIVYLAFLPHVFWVQRGQRRLNRRTNGTYHLGSQSTSGLSDHCQESARQADWWKEKLWLHCYTQPELLPGWSLFCGHLVMQVFPGLSTKDFQWHHRMCHMQKDRTRRSGGALSITSLRQKNSGRLSKVRQPKLQTDFVHSCSDGISHS